MSPSPSSPAGSVNPPELTESVLFSPELNSRCPPSPELSGEVKVLSFYDVEKSRFDDHTVLVSGPKVPEFASEVVEFLTKYCGPSTRTSFLKGQLFGFVQFESPDGQQKAMALSKHPISCLGDISFEIVSVDRICEGRDPRLTQEKSSLKNSTLVLKNLPFSCTQESIQGLLDTTPVVPLAVDLHHDSDGHFRGMVFVRFSDSGDAAKAFAALQNVVIGGRSVRVEYKNLTRSATRSVSHSTFDPPNAEQKKIFESLKKFRDDSYENPKAGGKASEKVLTGLHFGEGVKKPEFKILEEMVRSISGLKLLPVDGGKSWKVMVGSKTISMSVTAEGGNRGRSNSRSHSVTKGSLRGSASKSRQRSHSRTANHPKSSGFDFAAARSEVSPSLKARASPSTTGSRPIAFGGAPPRFHKSPVLGSSSIGRSPPPFGSHHNSGSHTGRSPFGGSASRSFNSGGGFLVSGGTSNNNSVSGGRSILGSSASPPHHKSNNSGDSPQRQVGFSRKAAAARS